TQKCQRLPQFVSCLISRLVSAPPEIGERADGISGRDALSFFREFRSERKSAPFAGQTGGLFNEGPTRPHYLRGESEKPQEARGLVFPALAKLHRPPPENPRVDRFDRR